MEQISIFDYKGVADNLKPVKSYDWKWTMEKDYPNKNGLTCFSCFACGGGSTMGYKLSGIDVIGDLEIDKRMNDVYVKNHNPKYNYLMDIRDFNKLKDLPEDLYNLDILDGSPPCSTFSMAGKREKSWGVEKEFKEGQAKQTLDDLPFVWIKTVDKLNPKVAIMENVEGILKGNAWKFVKRIYKELNKIGYKVRHYLLKGENMGVPQKRHRVFFIAIRNDICFDFNNINMVFNYEPILYKEIKEGNGKKITKKVNKVFDNIKNGEKYLDKAYERVFDKRSWFNAVVCYENDILPTLAASHSCEYDYNDRTQISQKTRINAGTFPQDYKYKGDISYFVGMSVPPIMIKRLVTRLIESGLFDYKLKKE